MAQNEETKSNLLNFIMLIRLFSGFYYNFQSSRLIEFIKRSYCVALMITLSILMPDKLIYFHLKSTDLIKPLYHLNFYLSLFYEKWILIFFTSVFKTDDILGFEPILISRPLRSVFLFLILIAMFTTCMLFMYVEISFISLLPVLFLLHDLPKILAFSIIYDRFKELRECLKCKYIEVNVVKRDQVKYKIVNLRKFVEIYSILLDSLKEAQKQLQVAVSYFKNI